MKKNIQNIKILLLFAFTVSDVTSQVLEDGKFDWQESFAFIPSMSQLPEVVKAIPEIPGELADLDKAERDELVAFVQDKFDLANDQIEQLIERSFKFLMDTFGGILELRQLILALPPKEEELAE